MPINKYVKINGFEFTLTTLSGRLEVMLDLGDAKIAEAIKNRDEKLFKALDFIIDAYDELDSVMLAEESFSMWLQSSYAEDRIRNLHVILNSRFASAQLKQTVRRELGYVAPPTNVTPIEWYAMMYGVYQAMSDEEKAELHAWEREHVDGSGKFSTADWPGWEKYIGKIPKPTPKDRVKRKGYIYLVRAATGEYKIGYSVDVKNRLKAFAVQPPFEYELIHTFPTDDMEQAEKALHERYSDKRIKGEWFALEQSDVLEIIQIVAFENGKFIRGEKEG